MSLARSNPNAMVQLGDDQIAVRIEGGFIVASQRKVRLYFGPHLYSATKGTPRPEDKVTPYQPGYMLLAAAMGATLMVPPSVKDPVTGQQVANPQVEYVANSSVIRSVKATAVCVARDAFGKFHASIQSITVDSESVLRQALLKLEREELVQYLSEEEVAADKAEGKLRGWVVVPFMPGYSLAGKASAAPVREALQTYNNLSTTIRQRACTKAERLACDHNPVFRMAWTYGDLLIDVKGRDGKIRVSTTLDGCRDGEIQVSLPYAEVNCVSWTESRDQAALQAFVDALVAQQSYEGVETTVGASFGDDEEVDNEPDQDDAPRQITEQVKPPALMIPTQKPEPVAVQAPAPEPAPVAAPAPVQAPAPAAPINGQAVLRLQGKCKGMEAQLPPPDVAWARNKAGIAPNADLDEIRDGAALERLMAALKEAADGAQ